MMNEENTNIYHLNSKSAGVSDFVKLDIPIPTLSIPPPLKAEEEESVYVSIKSLQCQALDSSPVSIEALKTKGLSQMSLTGLPDAWLRDSRDKIRSLVGSLGEWGPMARVLVHLLPAELSKVGAHLELPIVLACLAALKGKALGEGTRAILNSYYFIGSLSLDGRLVHTDVSQLLETEFRAQKLISPSHFAHLKELWEFLLEGDESRMPVLADDDADKLNLNPGIRVKGRAWERLWLMAAAVEAIPVLFTGAPGTGKSYLAKWAHQILPPPTETLREQCRRIWSLSGMQADFSPSFVQPSSRIHLSELLGFARQGVSRPGLFSLAHGGLLILDEYSELTRDCREVLRTVLDKKIILRNTKSGTQNWPAEFWLIATSNPCPCGFLNGADESKCRCPVQIRNLYRSRFSGPMLDRFGLKIHLQADRGLSGPWGNIDLKFLEQGPDILREKILSCRRDLATRPRLDSHQWNHHPSFQGISERSLDLKTRLVEALALLTGLSLDDCLYMLIANDLAWRF